MKKIQQFTINVRRRLHTKLYQQKANDVPIYSDEIKSCTVPVSNIVDRDSNPNIINIKNEYSTMWNCS